MTGVNSSDVTHVGREHGRTCFCFNCRGQVAADRRERSLRLERLRLEREAAAGRIEACEPEAEGEWRLPAEVASGGGQGVPRRAATEAGDKCSSGSPLYLESNRKSVEQEGEEGTTWFELRSCGCRSRFCPRCAVSQGLKLRGRLQPVLATFKQVQMWTLTMDPELFGSPAEGFEYARKKRCVAEWVRSLKDRGMLHSGRFFCVVEWQKETEMVHYHVLLDASFIPFETACDLWNRFRPVDAAPAEGDRPGFGSVRFSVPKFADAQHAAAYACKYMIKHPEHGYPDWVLDSCGEIKRYSTSKGLWTGHLGDAFEDGTGNLEFAPERDAVKDEAAEDQQVLERSTIRERLAECGKTAVVLEVTEVVDGKGDVQTTRRFVYKLGMQFGELLRRLGIDEKGANAVRLRPEEVKRLLEGEGEYQRGNGLGEDWL